MFQRVFVLIKFEKRIYKEIILIIKKHLRYIVEYVDSYDEILDEYKEV